MKISGFNGVALFAHRKAHTDRFFVLLAEIVHVGSRDDPSNRHAIRKGFGD